MINELLLDCYGWFSILWNSIKFYVLVLEWFVKLIGCVSENRWVGYVDVNLILLWWYL